MPIVNRTQARGRSWGLNVDDGDGVRYEAASLNVLQDIRDELVELNRIFRCQNFQDMPFLLRQVARYLKPKRKLRVVKKRRAA